MVDRLTQIELLMMITEDVRAEGQDIDTEVNQRYTAYAMKVLDLRNRLQRSLQGLDRELARVDAYLPKPEPMPKAVTQGPKQ